MHCSSRTGFRSWPFPHTCRPIRRRVRTVDFGSPAAKEAIDAWVRQQTANWIKQLFAQLDPTTLLVIANAVYFKGDGGETTADRPSPARTAASSTHP
jgi:serine protease inhibitor